jgi:hypothetical protein
LQWADRVLIQDGVLIVSAGNLTLKSIEDKIVSKRLAGPNGTDFGDGSEVDIGNWECVVQERLNAAEYLSGRVFLGSAAATTVPSPSISPAGAASSSAANSGTKRAAGTIRGTFLAVFAPYPRFHECSRFRRRRSS